jgi:molybdopterin-guanine dinucleotide biosynthesis protein B
VDLILVEGYKQANKPSIEILRAEIGLELIADPGQLLAIVTDTPVDQEAPQFALGDIVEVANLVESQFLRSQE